MAKYIILSVKGHEKHLPNQYVNYQSIRPFHFVTSHGHVFILRRFDDLIAPYNSNSSSFPIAFVVAVDWWLSVAQHQRLHVRVEGQCGNEERRTIGTGRAPARNEDGIRYHLFQKCGVGVKIHYARFIEDKNLVWEEGLRTIFFRVVGIGSGFAP